MPLKPPSDLAAEKAVLGGILHDPAMLTLTELKEDDFFSMAHREIFKAMRESKAIDCVTLAPELKKKGIIQSVADLSDLMSQIPSAANILQYAFQVRRASMGRKLMQIGQNLSSGAVNGNPVELSRKAIEALSGVDGEISIVEPETWDNLVEEFLNGKNVAAHPTGFANLDEKMNGGMHFGGTLMVGGDSGVGKTILCIAFIRECMRLGTPVYIVSRDQTNKDVAGRILSSFTGVERTKIRENEVVKARRELTRQWPLFFHPKRASFEIDNICNYIKIMVAKYGIRVWVVDFLQRIGVKLQPGQRSSEGHVTIADRFSDLAQDTNTCGVIISRTTKPAQGMPTQHRFAGEAGVQNACDDMLFVHATDFKTEECKKTFWPNEVRELELIGKRNFGRHFVPLKLVGDKDKYEGWEKWTYQEQTEWQNDRRK